METRTPIQGLSGSSLSPQEPPLEEAIRNSCGLHFAGRHDGLQRLKEWVAINGALTLTRAQAAKIACLQPHHFSKIFCQHAGESFQIWRRRYRIAWAVVALKDGTKSLAEVIHGSGYRDRRAFERSVRWLTGTTPGYIRRGSKKSDLSDNSGLPKHT